MVSYPRKEYTHMAKIWGVLRQGERIAKDCTVVFSEEFPPLFDIVEELCTQLDIPRPVILGKHEREWAQFLRTHFLQSDFIETLPYRRLEVEYLKERKKRQMY